MSTPHPIASSAPVMRGGGNMMNLGDSVYERLLRERIVFLGSEVGDANANEICAQLLLLAAEDSDRDIWLYINSPGGSVTAGMAIYDTMQWVDNDVATVALGLEALGRRAGELLLDAVAGHPSPGTTTLPTRLVVRESTVGS